MKKNSLTTALLAGLAGAAGLATTAHAVNINPDGLGQALVYPYYTVNGGNQTILSVVNTSADVKAVKVRFLESRNSREVLDFNLYLSPFDVWTASVFSTSATGEGGLVTNDNSCTAPAIKGNTTLPQTAGGLRYVPFRNFAYSADNNDGGGQGNERTREGHFEMIEMGVVRSGTAPIELGDEAVHGSNGVPKNCALIAAAWSNAGGVWQGGGAANATNSPTGGLFGAAAAVDVVNGTMLAYNAEALDGFYSTGVGTDDLHTFPGSLDPSLNDARTGSALPPVTSYVFSSGPSSTVVTSSWPRGIDAVSATLMVDALYNEYTTDQTLGAATEWVVTFPTKNFYVDSVTRGGRVSLPSFGANNFAALAPFAGLGFSNRTGTPAGGFACESVDLAIFDREEGSPAAGPIDFSPLPPGAAGSALCEETNVISFTQGGTGPSDILGSVSALNVEAPFIDGWLELSFPENEVTGREPGFTNNNPGVDSRSLDGDEYLGLPATGFEAVNVINANVSAGVLANYSGFFKHRGSRAITTSGT